MTTNNTTPRWNPDVEPLLNNETLPEYIIRVDNYFNTYRPQNFNAQYIPPRQRERDPYDLNFDRDNSAFTKQTYIEVIESDLDIYLSKLKEFILQYIDDLDNIFISGGFIYHLYRNNKLGEIMDFEKFSDIDVYVAGGSFYMIESKAENNTNLIYKNPNWNTLFTFPQESNSIQKKVQFINSKNYSVEQIINSFDLNVCKTYIKFQNNNKYKMWIDKRVIDSSNELIIDHGYGSINFERSDYSKTLERIFKYQKRYEFGTITFKDENLKIAYDKLIMDKILLQNNQCAECKKELKHISENNFMCPGCFEYFQK